MYSYDDIRGGGGFNKKITKIQLLAQDYCEGFAVLYEYIQHGQLPLCIQHLVIYMYIVQYTC